MPNPRQAAGRPRRRRTCRRRSGRMARDGQPRDGFPRLPASTKHGMIAATKISFKTEPGRRARPIRNARASPRSSPSSGGRNGTITGHEPARKPRRRRRRPVRAERTRSGRARRGEPHLLVGAPEHARAAGGAEADPAAVREGAPGHPGHQRAGHGQSRLSEIHGRGAGAEDARHRGGVLLPPAAVCRPRPDGADGRHHRGVEGERHARRHLQRVRLPEILLAGPLLGRAVQPRPARHLLPQGPARREGHRAADQLGRIPEGRDRDARSEERRVRAGVPRRRFLHHPAFLHGFMFQAGGSILDKDNNLVFGTTAKDANIRALVYLTDFVDQAQGDARRYRLLRQSTTSPPCSCRAAPRSA